ncbi:Multidrug resistance efflux transporter EmrE [Glarea lozoyensis ATCC 20868]|uniref:GDP-mannose transporter n=1 Tax=Glarea lozoyensis (strain ATCC 20868 / MF5171) TaxID=1116229 RepID=S3ED22_GLAL2|nr:Multidrug resistance efflux transporter EmrE [Glarea lozoyensis ATCC 20868]EPE36188.1 Multidrug resistance efflux transporter EmrE [Glarea lozoyensis ATCC 20868]
MAATDRTPSVSSSITEGPDEKKNSSDGSFVKLKAGERSEAGDDVERAELLPEDHEEEKPAAPTSKDNSTRTAIIWMVVNTLATIGIVFTNKAIFSDPSLKLAQLTFAAFHFFITWLTLFTLSRPRFGMFTPRRVAVKEIIPLAITMALNVILPNLSLAFSTVTFYQVARILLTPTVALMNFVLYRSTLPRGAVLALIPACVGVGMVSYYDSLPSADANIKTTSTLGVIFAFSGIFASSLYTVWIASYHKKLQMNSMQLLFNQAPLAAFMLLYVIPFVDTFPTWTEVPINRWVMIMMSGLFACVINMSQFFIIAQTGPVSSTVVGHVKTCTIVALGWMMSGRAVGDKSVLGVFVAVGGIITYSVVMLKHKAQGGK